MGQALGSMVPSWWGGLIAATLGLVGFLATHSIASLAVVPGQRGTLSLARFLMRYAGSLLGNLSGEVELLEQQERLRGQMGSRLLQRRGGSTLMIRHALGAGLSTIHCAVFGADDAPRIPSLQQAAGTPQAQNGGTGSDAVATSGTAGAAAGGAAQGQERGQGDGQARAPHGAGSRTAAHELGRSSVGPGRAPGCVIYWGGNAEHWEASGETVAQGVRDLLRHQGTSTVQLGGWRDGAKAPARYLPGGVAHTASGGAGALDPEPLPGTAPVLILAAAPAFGDSPSPLATRYGARLAALSALAFACDPERGLGFPPSRVVLWGHSLGAGCLGTALAASPGSHLVGDRTFGRLSDAAVSFVLGDGPALGRMAVRAAEAEAEAEAAARRGDGEHVELAAARGGEVDSRHGGRSAWEGARAVGAAVLLGGW